MKAQVIIVVNPYCRQGHGWKTWLLVKKEVYKSIGAPAQEIVLEKGINLSAVLAPFVPQAPPTCLLSAGGDGSIHYLVNTLLASDILPKDSITLGAIGLGSSNDFLKPFTKKIKGVPLRINCEGPTRMQDIGYAVFLDRSGARQKSYFIVNASFGLAAEANWNFDHPGKFLQLLKVHSTGAAILYAAVSTLLRHKNLPCSLEYNGRRKEVLVSNISVFKVSYVSGSFHYPAGPQPDDGRLGINICSDMSKRELLSTMYQLEKGRFPPGDKRSSDIAPAFHLSSREPLVFECDGETERVFDVNISVLPKAIRVLTT